MKKIRIGRFLSILGLCSRRNAKEFLENHDIYFEKIKIKDLNFSIDEAKLTEPIFVDGKEYQWQPKIEVILLNKPAGYVCSHKRQSGQNSVIELLPPAKRKFYFAGRLDRLSRGLMVFSNDGELIHKLTHPSFEIKKIYHVNLESPLTDHEMEKTIHGFYDRGEFLKFDSICPAKHSRYYEIVLHEGKNKEIRRVFDKMSHKVLDLKRIKLGKYDLRYLPEGTYRYINKI